MLLARPMERLRWLRVRKWKEEVESMVPLRAPKAFVGHRNWVYDTVWKEDKGQVRDMPGSVRLRPTQQCCTSPTATDTRDLEGDFYSGQICARTAACCWP